MPVQPVSIAAQTFRLRYALSLYEYRVGGSRPA